MATQGRGEATYRRLLAEGRERGWTLREVARRSGIPYWTLVGWKRRLGGDLESEAPRELPAMVPVTVIDPSPPARDDGQDESGSRPVLHLRASGHRLVLPATLSAEDLARVVRALESPGC